MTARRRQTVGRRGPAGATEETAAAPPVPSVDTVVTWIPGEVIAAYSAIVLASQPAQENGGDTMLEITWGGWLVGGIVLAAVITVLGGWSKKDDLDSIATRELTVRAILAATAFAIWSLVIPGSWWYSVDKIADNVDIVPIVAGIIGVVFSLFAEGLVRRLAP